MISENVHPNVQTLRGINFSNPDKRLQITTLAQWQLSDSATSIRPNQSSSEIRYPARLPMELPLSADKDIDPGG